MRVRPTHAFAGCVRRGAKVLAPHPERQVFFTKLTAITRSRCPSVPRMQTHAPPLTPPNLHAHKEREKEKWIRERVLGHRHLVAQCGKWPHLFRKSANLLRPSRSRSKSSRRTSMALSLGSERDRVGPSPAATPAPAPSAAYAHKVLHISAKPHRHREY
jgi:hypothetical protein